MSVVDDYDLLMENIAEWEDYALKRIAKDIKKIGAMSADEVTAINNMAIVNGGVDDILKKLSVTMKISVQDTQDLYDSYMQSLSARYKPLYDYRGKALIPFSENKKLQAIVNAFARKTAGTMINLAQTAALSVGIGKGKNFMPLKTFYSQSIDKAIFAVSSGATDFNTAMKETILEMGGSGLNIDYGGGVTRPIESVVRQTLMYGMKKATNEYHEAIGRELGCDGIEIDWHTFPRPSHEEMQGKQYVIGAARIINGVKYESADKPLSLLEDYNCYHFATPIICGVSEPTFSEEELKRLNEQNKKKYEIGGTLYTGYEVTQIMRGLENRIRQSDTIRICAKNSGNVSMADEYKKKVAALKAKYKEITDRTGIHYERDRMKVFLKKAS